MEETNVPPKRAQLAYLVHYRLVGLVTGEDCPWFAVQPVIGALAEFWNLELSACALLRKTGLSGVWYVWGKPAFAPCCK